MNTCILLEYTAKGEYNGIQCILPLLFSYQLTSPQSLISNIKYGKQASESTRIYLLSHNTHTINNAAKLKHVQVHLAPLSRLGLETARKVSAGVSAGRARTILFEPGSFGLQHRRNVYSDSELLLDTPPPGV